MATTDRRTPRWLKTMCLLGGLGSTLAVSGCGTDPSPEPMPGPVTTQAFLHLLDTQAGKLSTFEILASTGRLELRGSDSAPSSNTLATDPLGRYAYVGGADSSGVFVSTYSLVGGTPVHRHKLSLGPIRLSPNGLATYDQQVLVSFSTGTGYAARGVLASLRLDEATASLIPADEMRERDPRSGLTTDQGWKIAYWLASHLYYVSAHQTNPDGALRVVASSEETIAYGEGHNCYPYASGVATRGILFVPDTCGRMMTFALEGALIKNTSQIKGAFVPQNGTPALALSSMGQLAVATDAVRLYTFTDAGELTLKSQALGPYSSLAFHPAGEFLYASGNGRLKTFRIGRDGQLGDFDEVQQPTSLIAVTSPRNP